MLKPIRKSRVRGAAGKFVIVASKYNSRYVDGMLNAAREVLAKAAVAVEVVRVPGAFEIPVVVANVTRGKAVAAVICLGVILRGETTHAQHIGEAVSMALMQIQLQHRVPVIHEVLLLENEKQAQTRCLSTEHNRGAEAAYTALEMSRIIHGLRKAN